MSRTVPGNIHVKFKVCSSNRFRVISILAPQKFRGHVTLATLSFRKILRGHAWTEPGNMHVKFKVCSFNRFRVISILAPHKFRGHVTLPTPLFEKN